MFGANAFGWPYFGQAYPGGGSGGSAPEDNDTGTLLDAVAVSAVITGSDSAALAEGVPRIELSAVTDTAALADAGTANAQGPAVFDSDAFHSASTFAVAVTVAASDGAVLVESPPAIAIPNQAAKQDSDTATLADTGSNASGGVADAIQGICIAFNDNAFAAAPVWTRIDKPAGVR